MHSFERFAPKLAAAGVDHRIDVLRCGRNASTIGDVIVANAEIMDATLIVIAHSEKTVVEKLLRGSAVGVVTNNAPFPVLVVR